MKVNSNLSFSLSPDSTGKVHDLLQCLAKFGEYVSLEAKGDQQFTFGALNSSRTAYASFTLDPKTFFLSYNFGNSGGRSTFTCQMYNKALLSVFKGRTVDTRNPEGGIDRCDVSIEDQADKVKCRMIVKMICRNGVTKTYRLNYESVEVSHALFDRTTAPNSWRISSRLLREYIEFFSPKTEQLDFLYQDDKAVFTSFTEKVMDGKEVLKQPLETSITIHVDDFEDFHAEEGIHITISVKDFRAIVTHAETLKGSMTAYFSRPSRPLQFFYETVGMTCQFTLMTKGDDSTPSATPAASRATSARPGSKQTSRQSSRQPSFASNTASRQQSTGGTPRTNEVSQSTGMAPPPTRQSTDMAPPPRPSTISALRERRELNALNRVHSQATTASDRDPESLFVPRYDEEERQWDPPNFEEEPEEMLGWDANADIVSSLATRVCDFADLLRSMAVSIPLSETQAVMRRLRLAWRTMMIRKAFRRRKGCRRCMGCLTELKDRAAISTR